MQGPQRRSPGVGRPVSQSVQVVGQPASLCWGHTACLQHTSAVAQVTLASTRGLIQVIALATLASTRGQVARTVQFASQASCLCQAHTACLQCKSACIGSCCSGVHAKWHDLADTDALTSTTDCLTKKDAFTRNTHTHLITTSCMMNNCRE